MSKHVRTGIVLPGGWHYAANGKRRGYEAISYEDLLKKELDYRIENRLPVGDVKADVDSYICTTYPQQCQEADGPVLPPNLSLQLPSGGQRRFIDDLTEWAVNVYESGNVKLTQMVRADARAEKCIGCRWQMDWQSHCPPCVGRMNQLCAIIRQGKDVRRWSDLQGCGLLKFDTRTAVMLEDPRPNGDASKKPANCWL